MIADARRTVAAATDLIREAKSGRGLLATMLTDQEMAKDLRALVRNLRERGVLFYRDSAGKPEERSATPPPQPAPRRRDSRP